MDLEMLRERARIIRELRSFFDSRNYLELDTPLLSPDLIPETCLEVFETTLIPPQESTAQKEKRWLIPSPEIWMKKTIAAHRTNVYQICKCFRNGESRGRLHSPEFTMLEYYTMDADYLDSLALTETLLNRLSTFALAAGLLKQPLLRITMEEAFLRWAGFSLYETAAAGNHAMMEAAHALGLSPPPGLDTAALYDLIFIHAVEPALPRDRGVALLDYPAFVPCLARKKPGGRTTERWELYIDGIELANCYSEETDPAEVRRYFREEASRKEKTALVRHQTDEDYWKIFMPGKDCFPRCSGTALGVDRLIMVITGRRTIDGVLPFPS